MNFTYIYKFLYAKNVAESDESFKNVFKQNSLIEAVSKIPKHDAIFYIVPVVLYAPP